MKVQLPNGLIDGQDYFNYVVIDELRGKQQNYLADKDLVIGNIGHIPKLVSDLVKSLQTKEGLEWKGDMKELCWKLTATDIEIILLKVRENTYGPMFYHMGTCKHCEHVHKNMKLSLDTLEVDCISLEELLDVKKRTIVLPKSQMEVELKPLYLRDLFDVLKTTQNKTNQLVTSLSALSMKRLGDKSPVTSTDLDELPARDIAFLGDVVQSFTASDKPKIKLEGSIDTQIEFTCENCNKDSEVKLNVFDPDFFDPSKAGQI